MPCEHVRILTPISIGHIVLSCTVLTGLSIAHADDTWPSLRSGGERIHSSRAVDETAHFPGHYTDQVSRARRGALRDGTAAAFDGSAAWLRIPAAKSGIGTFGEHLESCTIEFWYSSRTKNPGNCIAGSVNDGANTAVQIEWDQKSGRLMLLLRSDGGPDNLLRCFMSPRSSAVTQDGKFHHVVWAVDSAARGRVRVYLDGTEDSEAVVEGRSRGKFRILQHDLVFGASNVRGHVQQFAQCTLDEIALYAMPLSAARVQRHREIARARPTDYADTVLQDMPLAYWRLDEYAPENLHLAVDSRSVEKIRNAVLRVRQAAKHPANPLFGQTHPWEVMFNNMYPNVIFDLEQQQYRLWYSMFVVDSAYAETIPAERTPGTYMERVRVRRDGLAVAVSKDGLTWSKPLLGEFKWEQKPSNLVARDVHGAGIMKDPAERDPARRYKMLCRGGTMSVRFSADGVRWGEFVACPEIAAAGDTHNNALWSPELERYVAFTRLWQGPIRVVGRTESRDFVHWTKAREVLRGQPLFDVYSMPVIRYAGIYIGLPAIFDEQSDRVQTELAWSPDTIHWHRIEPGRPLIANSATKGTYDWGTVYASRPVITNQGIRIYYGGCDGGHFDWRNGYLCLATLRPDGFAGYEPEDGEHPATVETRPLPFSSRLRVTTDAEGGSLTVTALDTGGQAILTSQPIRVNGTDLPIEWKTGPADPNDLIGKQLILRFTLRNARLYSYLR